MGFVKELFNTGPSSSEKATEKLQAAQAEELRREENRQKRGRAARTRVLSSQARGASLFPSDFAPRGSSTLGPSA